LLLDLRKSARTRTRRTIAARRRRRRRRPPPFLWAVWVRKAARWR
jgi:hypothetical protein